MDLNLLRTFVVACEEGGISAAAERLNLPKSTVSRRLTRLEEDLDRSLVDRSSAGLTLTAQGRLLFEDVRPAIHALEPLDYRARKSARTQESFVIEVPRLFAEGVLNPILLGYLADHPEQTVELLQGDRFSEARAGRADLVIRVGTPLSQSADERPLMTVEARLYAAPDLFTDRTAPQVPSELGHWPYLSLCTVAGVPDRLNLESSKGKITTVALRTRIASNEISTLTSAALRGLGITQLPEFIGDPFVEREHLVRVLPDHRTDRFLVTATLTQGTRNTAARLFADHLEASLRG